jgi:DNA-binding MarR family transcriptional regulator
MSDTSTLTPLTPQILGLAENAQRALLERTLAASSSPIRLTYQLWVALAVTAGSEGQSLDREQVAARVAAGLKIDRDAALATLAELAEGQLIEDIQDGQSVVLTETGLALFRQISSAGARSVARLYADVPADDLAIAGRVLTVITARADAELARG